MYSRSIRVVLVASLLLAAGGCSSYKVPTPQIGGLTADADVLAVSIKDMPAEPPEFRREYSATVSKSRGVTMKLTARSAFNFRRFWDGELTQSDGRWVLFDPDKPADKILDAELLPIVQRLCSVILEHDRQFISSAPDSFIDSSGQRWERSK